MPQGPGPHAGATPAAVRALEKAGLPALALHVVRPDARESLFGARPQLGPVLKGDAAARVGRYGGALEHYLGELPTLQECVSSRGVARKTVSTGFTNCGGRILARILGRFCLCVSA